MRKIFTLIFVCLLLAPAAAWLIELDFGIHVKRIGLKPPRLDGRVVFENEYYLSFDQYFNDSFSLRSPLIFAKRWLDYRIFRMTDVKGVHVGSDGWLYSRQSITDYRKEGCNHKTNVRWMVLELHALEKIIEASKRRFFFIVAPNKSTIYPEFVGFVPPSTSCKRSRYDLLLETISEHPLKSFVRLDNLLREAKQRSALLYDRASTFWNGLGAMVAAEAIHRQIFEDPQEEPVLDYTAIGLGDFGDLNSQLMGFFPLNENGPVKHFKGSGQSDFPAGIAYSDNYMPNLLPYVVQSFSQLDVIRSERVPSSHYGEDLLAYDIILLEKAESELGTIHIELDKIFSVFEAEAQIPARYQLNLQNVVPLSHISLDHRAEGLEIKSVGAQSVFKLKSIPASDDNIFRVLKLSIEAPYPDLMTIKYITDLSYVTRKSLKAGLTNVYLPLPFKKSQALHINPGDKAGVLMLRSAEILEFFDMSGTEEPSQQKNYYVVMNQKERHALPHTDSQAFHTKSAPETHISAPKKADQNSESNPRMVAPGGIEVSRLKKFLAKVADPNSQENITPKDSDVLSKTKSNNSISMANSAEGEVPTAKAAFKKDEVPTSTALSITVTDFKDGRIFQRKGRNMDIVVSGTYTGQLESIEARVVMNNTFEEIVPWTIIDSFPKNEIFVGVLKDVPQGGWYNIQVRSTKDHSIASIGRHKWGVGILVACLGQSNMKEWFFTGMSLSAHPLLRKFTDGNWSELGNKGHAAIAFGNRIIDRLGIPVGLLDYSKNGSGLRKEADWGTGYWQDTASGSIYNHFIAGVSDAGSAIEFIIWIQGEADAARGTVTEDEYRTSLESFITNQVRADIDNGSDREYLPFLIVMMIKRPGGKDEPHQSIRNAQKHVAENVPSCYLAATTLDLKNQGRQHLTPRAYITLGHRVAQTVLYILGQETYYRGPAVNDVKQIDNRTLEITIKHRGGTDFTPVSSITGWEVLANGYHVPIANVYRHDPHTIRIILKRPLAGRAKVRYLHGAMPDVANPVADNSALSLPLEEFQSQIN